MTRDDVLRELNKLSPADREEIRATLNRRAEIDGAQDRLKGKLEAERQRLDP